MVFSPRVLVGVVCVCRGCGGAMSWRTRSGAVQAVLVVLFLTMH